jgi:hypothetical protein
MAVKDSIGGRAPGFARLFLLLPEPLVEPAAYPSREAAVRDKRFRCMPSRLYEMPPLLGQFAPETILWVPEAITDQAGHLELDIALPDVPSVWRLTALASTRNGELGEASAKLQAGP